MKKWAMFVLWGMLSVVYSVNAGVIDRSQVQYDDYVGWSGFVIGSGNKVAQTFTAGITGQLQTIQVKFGNFQSVADTPQYPVDVSIVETRSTVPSGALLASVTVDAFAADFTVVDFSDYSIFLDSGAQYAIVMTSEDSNVYDEQSTQWRGSSEDVYSGGQMWVWTSDLGWIQEYSSETVTETYYNVDCAFKTYMTPEPATALFLSFGYFLSLIRKPRVGG